MVGLGTVGSAATSFAAASGAQGGGGAGSISGGLQGLLAAILGTSSFKSAENKLARLQDLGIAPPSPGQGFAMPRLFQLLSLGGEPQELSKKEARELGLFRKSRKGTLGPEFVKVSGRGRRSVFARTPTLDDILSQSAKAERRFLDAEQKSLDRIRQTPLGASLLADLDGPGAAFQTAFNRLGSATLGGAAGAGLNLQDPVVKARVLGPVALQEALTSRQLERSAATSGFGLTRGPLSTAGFAAPPGINFLSNNFLASSQLGQTANIFNTGIQGNALAAQSGLKAGLAQSFANIAGSKLGLGDGAFSFT